MGYYWTGQIYRTLILHWNGQAWSQVISPNLGTDSNYLLGIVAPAANDIWAVGSYNSAPGAPRATLALRWNGATWSAVALPNPNPSNNNALTAVAANTATDVWAVGNYYSASYTRYVPLLLHWDGISWTHVNAGGTTQEDYELRGVAALGFNNIWMVGYRCCANGYQAAILRFTGNVSYQFIPMVSTNMVLNAVDGSAPNDIWAVGSYRHPTTNRLLAQTQHWNGSAWSLVSAPDVQLNLEHDLNGLDVLSATDVWAGGSHWSSPNNNALFYHYSDSCSGATPTLTVTATPATTHTPTATATHTSTPTGTATATATAPPAQRVLVGHVTWQGRPAQPNPAQQLPLTLVLQSGATTTSFANVQTDASGFFTVPVTTLPNGVYTWWVKGGSWLASSGQVTLSGAPVTQQELGLQRAGDVNNDNLVDITDFTLVRASFGKVCGDAGYNGQADWTGDCLVDITDFTLLRSNFGQPGAPPP